MDIKQAIKSMMVYTQSDNVDVIITDKNDMDHRITDINGVSDELYHWLLTEEFSDISVSSEEEAVLLKSEYNSNEIAFILDGESLYYYPEYTDNYYSSLMENGTLNFEDKMSVLTRKKQEV